MSPPPAAPAIFHITHIDNLASIVADGCLWSDAEVARRIASAQAIGMSKIKRRRIEKLEVDCHAGTKVGDYVPFYFAPRSIMLYVIHQANHEELAYRGGQEPILHLEADLHSVVGWANAQPRRWAFSTSNAGAYYTTFFNDIARLDQIDWTAVAARNFRDADVKEKKQAEFLLHEAFPWHLVRSIGVVPQAIARRVETLIATAQHKPTIAIHRDWYY